MLHELFAVALRFDFGRPLDPVEIGVLLERRFLAVLISLAAGNGRLIEVAKAVRTLSTSTET
jgi:hypothetical protein